MRLALADLFYAAPLGLIGGAVGLLFMLSLSRLQRLFQPMKAHVVLRGLLGGLGMGLIGALLPLTLFSGEAQTADLITHAAEIGVLMLIVLGAGQAVRHLPAARHRLERRLHLPHHVRQRRPGPGGEPPVSRRIPVAVTVAATMAGALVAALKAPLFAALFTTVLVQKETAPVIAVAVVVSALLTALLALRAARRAAGSGAAPSPAGTE